MSALSLAIDAGIAVVTFDQPGAPVNTLGSRVAAEFAALFDRLEQDASVQAAVLVSEKPDVWIAGADIEQLRALRSASDVELLSRQGQAMLDRLERLRVPVVAAVHGACLGGGLEVALACAHRVASEHPRTVFALPEVQLGLIPGAGGTQRLPRTVGLQAALDMILTGKNVRARKALQLGIVHDLVHPAILRDVAVRRARELADGTRPRPPRASEQAHRGHGAAMLLEDNPLGRAVVFRKAREQVMAKTRGHYPAPLAALDVVATGFADGYEAGLREEARRFGELAMSPVSRELVYLFFATTALKKDAGVADDAGVEAATVERLGVLGAGFMGAGIAAVSAMQHVAVRLKDADHARVGKGLAAVRGVLDERLRRKQVTRTQFENQLALVSGTVDYSGFRNADLVIEAVFEELSVKHMVLREVEAAAPRAIFASNTSTIPIARIAEASAHRERVLGMHFFSPVHRMPLLEVIVTDDTAPAATATAVAFGKRLGKTVIVVRDGPGFYVNRILTPYVNEAGHLLDEGVAVDAIDSALVAFGFPVGPVTLVDEVGLDVAGKSGKIMTEAFGERMAPSQAVSRVLAGGRTGRKGRRGFYLYDAEGKKGGVDASVYELLPAGTRLTTVPRDDIQRRTVFGMLNEAVRCLEDGILRSPRDGDVGAVFGIGFPPFLGGPFRYMDALGAAAVVGTLDALDARFPGRFRAAHRLRAMAASGARFHDR